MNIKNILFLLFDKMFGRVISKPFKVNFGYDEREKEAKKKMEDFPGYVPVVIERKIKNNKGDVDWHISKFLVPHAIKYKDFIGNVIKKLSSNENVIAVNSDNLNNIATVSSEIQKNMTYIFFTNGKKLERGDAILEDIYNQNKDDDGFLYITCTVYDAYG